MIWQMVKTFKWEQKNISDNLVDEDNEIISIDEIKILRD